MLLSSLKSSALNLRNPWNNLTLKKLKLANPTSLLKQCTYILRPTIINIINLSLSTGIFPDQFKNCSVRPHLKKSNLDKDDLCNYRPIYHLSFLSKLTERVVKLRLADYLSINSYLLSSLHQTLFY